MSKKIIFFVLALLVALTYFNSLFHEFTGDDRVLFINNDFYRQPANLAQLVSSEFLTDYNDLDPASASEIGPLSFSGFVAYRPVTALFFFWDAQLWGSNPPGFHLTNLILHLGIAFLVYLTLNILLGSPVAFLAAALFAVHPVQAEVINSIGYRSDLAATLFYLAAFLGFIRYRQGQRGRILPLVCSALLFFLAVFSKESAVTLPLVLIAYDRLYARRTLSASWKTYVPFFALLAFYLYVYFRVFPNSNAAFDPGFHLGHQLRIAAEILLHNISALLWPPLVKVLPPLYWPPGLPLAGSVLVLAGLIAALWFGYRRLKNHPGVLLCVVWFVLTYLPTANLIPFPNPFSYRLLYLPSVGMFGFLAFVLVRVAARLKERTGQSKIEWIVKGGVLALCLVTTISLNGFYRNNIVACREMTRNFPEASHPHWILGLEYSERQQYDKAIPYFEKYLELGPRNPFVAVMKQDYLVYHQLGRCYIEDPRRAIEYFKKSIELRPDYICAHLNLSKAYLLNKDYPRALQSARETLAWRDDLALAYVYAAHSAFELGKREEASALLQEGLRRFPADSNLGYLQALMNKNEQPL